MLTRKRLQRKPIKQNQKKRCLQTPPLYLEILLNLAEQFHWNYSTFKVILKEPYTGLMLVLMLN